MNRLNIGLTFACAILAATVFSSTQSAYSQSVVAQQGITQTHPHSYESLKRELALKLADIDAELQKSDTAALQSAVDAALSNMARLAAEYYSSPNQKTAAAYLSHFKIVRFKLKPLLSRLEPHMEKPFDVLDVMEEYESDTLVVDWKEVETMTASWKGMIFRYAEADTRVETINSLSEQIADDRIAQGDPITLKLYDEADLQAVEKHLSAR